MSVLRLTYHPVDDAFGRIHAEIEIDGLSAQSFAVFSRVEIEQFAQELAAFPIAATVALAGGRWDLGDLYEVGMRISIAPRGTLGKLAVRVFLSPTDPALDLPTTAKIQFETDYGSLGSFRDALLRALSDADVVAVLSGG
jgi:hypothetical protein